MSAMQGALSAAERSMRSVFVGNIPYEATEEQLKDIFSEVGPVVSFRLVYDRETGKPKGYGFCEYKDQEMALSAMRNLNGYELNGRALRVDNAASEKSKEELKNLQASLGGPPVESPYGPEVSPEKAPEAIAKVMASLPPEQLYELMKQMKVCIENNPNEARSLLFQNPQLAYALLQAQVIMRIVDPEVAMGMLHGPNGPAPPAGLLPTPDIEPVISSSPMISIKNEMITSSPVAMSSGPMASNAAVSASRTAMPQSRPSLLGDRPPVISARPDPMYKPFDQNDLRPMGDHDLRQAPLGDHDMRPPPMLIGDKDMRQPIVDQDFRTLGVSVHGLPENRPFDPRFRADVARGMQGPEISRGMQGPEIGRPVQGPEISRSMTGPEISRSMTGPEISRSMTGPEISRSMTGPEISRSMTGPEISRGIPGPEINRGLTGADITRSIHGANIGAGSPFDRPRSSPNIDPRSGYEGRPSTTQNRMDDPRNVPIPAAPTVAPSPRLSANPRVAAVVNSGSPIVGSASPSAVSSPRQSSGLAAAAAAIAPHDQEKAALIMQVLQLSDQQIAMLPTEQRQSIMVLKEQIARSQQAS